MLVPFVEFAPLEAADRKVAAPARFCVAAAGALGQQAHRALAGRLLAGKGTRFARAVPLPPSRGRRLVVVEIRLQGGHTRRAILLEQCGFLRRLVFLAAIVAIVAVSVVVVALGWQTVVVRGLVTATAATMITM